MEKVLDHNIDVEVLVEQPVDRVFLTFTTPADITQWNSASADWVCPKAELNLVEGGNFNYRMEAKDGSMGFDFDGTFDKIVENELIEYTIGDGRKVLVEFFKEDNCTRVVENFEAEKANSIEMQKGGWQAILNSFKTYTEAKYKDSK